MMQMHLGYLSIMYCAVEHWATITHPVWKDIVWLGILLTCGVKKSPSNVVGGDCYFFFSFYFHALLLKISLW